MPVSNIMTIGITLAATEDMPLAGEFTLDLQSITAGAHPVSRHEGQKQVVGDDRVSASRLHCVASRGPRL